MCLNPLVLFSDSVVRVLEESKTVVLAKHENNSRRRIREALDILCQFLTLDGDRGFEPPALYGDAEARDLVHPNSRDK